MYGFKNSIHLSSLYLPLISSAQLLCGLYLFILLLLIHSSFLLIHSCFFTPKLALASESPCMIIPPLPPHSPCMTQYTPWQLIQVVILSELCVPWSLGHHQGDFYICPTAAPVVSPPVFRDKVLPPTHQPSLHSS